MSLGVGYALSDLEGIDENVNAVSGSAAFELPLPMVSVCPSVGIKYSWISEKALGIEAGVSSITVPIGFAIGKRLSAGESFFVTPFAAPQFLYMRREVSATDGTTEISETESFNEFGGVLGVVLGIDHFYAGGSVSMTTFEDADPVFAIGVGFTLP